MKKRKLRGFTLAIIFALIVIGGYFLLTSTPSMVKKLYDMSDGFSEIEECTYEGKKVYSYSFNAADAGSDFYDGKGSKIGSCNYAFGQVDSICEDARNCITVYRVEDNIWGRPAVDKYGLNN